MNYDRLPIRDEHFSFEPEFSEQSTKFLDLLENNPDLLVPQTREEFRIFLRNYDIVPDSPLIKTLAAGGDGDDENPEEYGKRRLAELVAELLERARFQKRAKRLLSDRWRQFFESLDQQDSTDNLA